MIVERQNSKLQYFKTYKKWISKCYENKISLIIINYIVSTFQVLNQTPLDFKMEILRSGFHSVLGGGGGGSNDTPTPADTIERLVDRLVSSTLLVKRLFSIEPYNVVQKSVLKNRTSVLMWFHHCRGLSEHFCPNITRL